MYDGPRAGNDSPELLARRQAARSCNASS